MTDRLKVLKRGAMAAVVFAGLALGAPLPGVAVQDAGTQMGAGASAVASLTSFPVAEAERVLSFGFETITERYLESVTVEQLAVGGLRGLGSIDPGLVVAQRDRNIELSTADRIVMSHALPPRDDPQAWATAVVRLTLAARQVSPTVAKANVEDVYSAMFDAILADLDGFSRYASAAGAQAIRARRNGFGGVGIRYNVENGALAIREVLSDTPAASVGLKAGDRITHIEGTPVVYFADGEAISAAMRGEINAPLRLTVMRNGAAAATDMVIRRGLVVPQTVTTESMDDGIVHMRISSFNQNTARNVAEAMDRAKRQLGRDLRGVLLDLRGNPGGLLDQAVAVSDMFVNQGRIVSTRGRHPGAQQSYSARQGDVINGLPVVVMLDGRSASAAEIVAAALQDSGRAVVVGSSSYGKGTVQTVVRMPNNGEMTITWSRFHSPSGYALHGLGVTPTVCVREPSASPDAVLSTAALEGPAITAHLTRWRTTPLEDTQGRQALREVCPPTSQDGWESDAAISRRLLSDHALYARALAASGTGTRTATQ